MSNVNKYIELAGRWCRLMKENKKDDADIILEKTQEIWEKLSEEEKMYADEQTIGKGKRVPTALAVG